ncbi:MAG: ferrous iron transport protein A [Clostridiales bacterium]|nr:ferrous iron transport protein A [Clostridiales bacterium]
MRMNELQPGQCAYIQAVEGEGALRHHLLDMGLTPGTEITLQKIAPMGDPIELRLRGYELSIRLEDAEKIQCDIVSEERGVGK